MALRYAILSRRPQIAPRRARTGQARKQIWGHPPARARRGQGPRLRVQAAAERRGGVACVILVALAPRARRARTEARYGCGEWGKRHRRVAARPWRARRCWDFVR